MIMSRSRVCLWINAVSHAIQRFRHEPSIRSIRIVVKSTSLQILQRLIDDLREGTVPATDMKANLKESRCPQSDAIGKRIMCMLSDSYKEDSYMVMMSSRKRPTEQWCAVVEPEATKKNRTGQCWMTSRRSVQKNRSDW